MTRRDFWCDDVGCFAAGFSIGVCVGLLLAAVAAGMSAAAP